MSIAARHEANPSLTEIANQINTDFNDVAKMLPLDAKTGGAGLIVPISAVEGLGTIGTMFLGKDESRNRFMLRLVMRVEELGFYKDYELADYHISRGGVPYETKAVVEEDLVDCPGSVNALGASIHALREDFFGLRSID